MFVSVHMLVKENTNLGKWFLKGSFKSLLQSEYPNEIVLVDNGCSKDVLDEVIFPWEQAFKDSGIDFKYHTSDLKLFRDLRNFCLEHTNPHANFWHWIDSDEIYYPEDLDVLKNYTLEDALRQDVSLVYSYFYHMMIHPFQVQNNPDKRDSVSGKWKTYNEDDFRSFKDNIFAFTPDVKWNKPVHEKVSGLKNSRIFQSSCEYIHLGYCRSQWRTFLKWLHYDVLEHGHVGGYKLENIEVDADGINIGESKKPAVKTIQKDYLRDWRYPDNCLWDRNSISIPFPAYCGKQHVPEGVRDMLDQLETQDEAGWKKWIESIDDRSFYERWEAKKNEVGCWKDTLDWAVEEAEKLKWGFV